MRIGFFGTFDVENFGDVLFPIVAESMLKSIDPSIEVELYSLLPKRADSWYYDVHPMQDLPARIGGLDMVVVGGGHLLHANRLMLRGYGPSDPSIPHPWGFWWLPVVAGKAAGLPTALHCISSDPHFPDWTRPLLEQFGTALDYANARDDKSIAKLRDWNPAAAVVKVPDSVFNINTLIKRGDLSAEAKAFLNDHGLSGRPYLIVQPSSALRKYMPFMQALAADAVARRWGVLNLPIIASSIDAEGFFAGTPGVTTAKHWPHPRLLAEIIANASAVSGVSLHLSIVASTYGIRVFRPRYAETSKFILLRGLGNIRFMDDAQPVLDDVADTPVPDPLIAGWQAELRTHYEQMIALARGHQGKAVLSPEVWTDLTAKPDALRARQGLGDRVAEVKQNLKRRRGFLAMLMLPRLRKAASLFRFG